MRSNRSADRLLIANTNLDGFSLANHGRFAKFARQIFPLYNYCKHTHVILAYTVEEYLRLNKIKSYKAFS